MNHNRAYANGSEVTCWYYPGNRKLALSAPTKDKLVGLWWFFVSLGICCAIPGLILLGSAGLEWIGEQQWSSVSFAVFPTPSKSKASAPTPDEERPPSQNPETECV